MLFMQSPFVRVAVCGLRRTQLVVSTHTRGMAVPATAHPTPNRVRWTETGTVLDCPRQDDFAVSPIHRVVLHHSGWTEVGEPVISQQIRHAVPRIEKERAANVAKTARLHGRAIVLMASPDVAEDAVYRLRAQGLRASLEEE